MIKVDCNYEIRKDIESFLEMEEISMLELSEMINISRPTLEEIVRTNTATKENYEKIYSYMYEKKYRINKMKEELLKEKETNILFHGSKNGLEKINIENSRENCDFGKGFYLGETYNQAVSFVCEKENSSVYSFKYDIKNLRIKKFECNLDWMLAICYYRGSLNSYNSSSKIEKIIKEIESADVIIAPIADNKMFFIMTQFVEGEINADVALHSLSASSLGLQYVFKTNRALNSLVPIERYYLSTEEKKDYVKILNERSYEINTKLKLSKREFKNGLFIEEILR